jgi:hypothetical protein
MIYLPVEDNELREDWAWRCCALVALTGPGDFDRPDLLRWTGPGDLDLALLLCVLSVILERLLGAGDRDLPGED